MSAFVSVVSSRLVRFALPAPALPFLSGAFGRVRGGCPVAVVVCFRSPVVARWAFSVLCSLPVSGALSSVRVRGCVLRFAR